MKCAYSHGQTIDLLGRAPKVGIEHAQRFKDALTEKDVERLTAPYLDKPPEHVGGDRIVEVRARLEQQRGLTPVVYRTGEVDLLVLTEFIALLRYISSTGVDR